MKINEIETIPTSDYRGGDSELGYHQPYKYKNMKPLPGGSRFVYALSGEPGAGRNAQHFTVVIFDPTGDKGIPKTIGKLGISPVLGFPVSRPYQVGAITVSEKYRGQGIGLALYGIVLNVLKITLLAGHEQTPGGRKNWLNMASIPGVEVLGYVKVDDADTKTQRVPTKARPLDKELISNQNDFRSKVIDQVMMLGGEYLGKYKSWHMPQHVFVFPVTGDGNNLKNAVKGSGVKLYDNQELSTGMLARWVG